MIVIVTSNKDTFSNPTICGIIEVLKDRGVNVSVISKWESVFGNTYDNVKVYEYPYGAFPTFRRNILLYGLSILNYYLIKLKIVLAALMLRPEVMIGVDPTGIRLAGKLKRICEFFLRRKIRLDYASFEIFFADEGDMDKKEEIRYSKDIQCLIIQDPTREALLRKENGYDSSVRTFLIPVAPYIPDHQTIPVSINFRDKYGIAPDKKMFLFFGTFSIWSGAEILFELIDQGIPEDVVLVVHSRFKLNSYIGINRRLLSYAESSGGKVIVDDEYIGSFAESVAFIRQFDGGLVYYIILEEDVYSGKNISQIGLSSGKFSMFMCAGVPVIASKLPAYSALLKDYGFGRLASDAETTMQILRGPWEKSSFSNECIRLFNEKLDPVPAIRQYVDSLFE